MSVLDHARTHAPAAPLARTVAYSSLGPHQRERVNTALAELGIEDGRTIASGITDPVLRALHSELTALHIGLRLPYGDELAQCADCSDIGSANDMNECDDGAWRCTIGDPDGYTCLGRYLAAQ
jgi:hypothetical protein